jgi:hypothetical protein
MSGFFGFNPFALAIVAYCTTLTLWMTNEYLPGLNIGLGIIIILPIVEKLLKLNNK